MDANKLYNTDKETEKVILIGIDTGNNDIELNFIELRELCLTAGVEVVGEMLQKRDAPHSTTYFGKGKIEELKDHISLNNATGVIADDELGSIQMKKMSELLDIKVMDRTMLILDIFAKRALSSEGRAQVELAQLKYNSSRLIGLGKVLSRQAGGIKGGVGSRGPGEKKLETDRRHIRLRISELEKEINGIKVKRQTQREQRQKKGVPVVSLVGYTNAGKSTLMNYLTDSDILSEDKLFATLDTTTRKLKLPSSLEILFTDTVGFIQKLPHTLIKAFNATLEELKYADILVHVVDISNKYYKEHIKTVNETLKELGCDNKPVLMVLNKIDLLNEEDFIYEDNIFSENDKPIFTVSLSALTGEGIEILLNKIEDTINSFGNKIDILLPFSEGSLISYIHKFATVLNEEYKDKGVYMTIISNDEIYSRVKDFQVIE